MEAPPPIPPGAKRQDTKLESEGAEFLVLGMLLIEGIQCFKAYTNFSGYDLVAVGSSGERNARIQVKSRWATDYDRSFPIRNFACDFVVLAALNRGYRFRPKPLNEEGRSAPSFYCFPVELVRAAQNSKDKWGKVSLSRIPNCSDYLDAWYLIRNHLEVHG